jgi:ketosteroid isomerase-like protein
MAPARAKNRLRGRAYLRMFWDDLVFVPEGLSIVGRQFIAGLFQKTIRVPEGRLKAARAPN